MKTIHTQSNAPFNSKRSNDYWKFQNNLRKVFLQVIQNLEKADNTAWYRYYNAEKVEG